MDGPIPADVSSRPRAATRYLDLGRDGSRWRITVVFQGAYGLRRLRGQDEILGERPPLEPQPGQQPVWGLSVVLSGSAVFADRAGGSVALSAGGWYRFAGRSPSEVRVSPAPGFAEMAVSTDCELGDRLAGLGLWPEQAHAQAAPDPAVLAAGWELYRALRDPVVIDHGLIRRLVALSERVRLATAVGADSSFRERACRLLAAHPEPGFALAAAARELGLPEQLFRKRFAREVGMPPGRWHQRRRIERATQLLASMPVAEVARQLGYSDRTAFSRQFRQATGRPPRSLRTERD
jgi:AraC-like DNA-binding protein